MAGCCRVMSAYLVVSTKKLYIFLLCHLSFFVLSSLLSSLASDVSSPLCSLFSPLSCLLCSVLSVFCALCCLSSVLCVLSVLSSDISSSHPSALRRLRSFPWELSAASGVTSQASRIHSEEQAEQASRAALCGAPHALSQDTTPAA